MHDVKKNLGMEVSSQTCVRRCCLILNAIPCPMRVLAEVRALGDACVRARSYRPLCCTERRLLRPYRTSKAFPSQCTVRLDTKKTSQQPKQLFSAHALQNATRCRCQTALPVTLRRFPAKFITLVTVRVAFYRGGRKVFFSVRGVILQSQAECCHCEEQSDEAISGSEADRAMRLLRCARNDNVQPVIARSETTKQPQRRKILTG
jgi:hypothetical protein